MGANYLVALHDNLAHFSYDFNVCDYSQVESALANIDWIALLRAGTLDSALLSFYDKLYEIFDKHVPRKRRSTNAAFNQPWWTTELHNHRNQLKKVRHHFFLTKSENDQILLHEVESLYKSVLLCTYEDYIVAIQESVKQNSSNFWAFVKNQKCSARTPCNVSSNDAQATSKSEAANLFASFFENVFSRTSPVQ